VAILLAVAVVLVSFGGAPDLVELGRVACVRFLPVSPENRAVMVFLVWFSYKLDTWCRVASVSVFGRFPL
jgi:hypothetical protein